MENQSLSIAERTHVEERVRDFILTKLLEGEEPINLTSTTPLVSGGIIDSLNSRRLGLFLQKAFAIHVAPEDLADPENLETVTAIVDFVMARSVARDGGAAGVQMN